jgi:hypothetical protein
MQYGFAVLAGSQYAYSQHFMCTVYGQKHWLGWHFIRMSGTYDYLAGINSTYHNHMPRRYLIFFGKTLDT